MRTFLFALFALLLLAPVALHAQGETSGVSLNIQPRIGPRLCLDARGDRDQDGAPVAIYTCHGSENQRWTVTASPNNQHAIIGIGGFCLDVRGTNATANGTPAQLWKCHFGENQRFSFMPDGRIREVRSGKCLIAAAPKDGTPVVLDTCKNNPGEIWSLHRNTATLTHP